VDAIEREPKALVTWLPTQTPGAEQVSAAAFERCEQETRRILEGYLGSDTALLAGHRKDVVIAPWMPADKVVIFGARWVHGPRIQPLFPAQGSAKGHEAGYADYSHGVRAVRRACLLDGKPALLDDVLAAGLCGGPVARLRYETPVPEARPTPTISAVLRRGSRGAAVVELQTLLAGAGYPCQIDSIFGEKTAAAVVAFQRSAGLADDGIAGPRTMTALRGLGDTERPPPNVPPALSDDEVDELFGPMLWTPAPTASEPGAIRITNNWQKVCLRMVEIPQLRGIPGAPASCKVPLHVLVVEQTRALWAAWEKAGLLPLVLSWAGSWNPRLVRGGSTLSRHAYAVSFDINAAQNPMGKAPAPRGAKGSVVELVPLAVEHGFTWGGAWDRPDGMHVESFKVL
jgi:peptidoglycan hydrolase-like protein with peptidoglycan-binding domain